MVYAWSGAQDQAVDLIEELTSRYPGVGPAEIAREPLFTVPLAGNARFQAVVKKLEREIAENRIRFDRADGGPQ